MPPNARAAAIAIQSIVRAHLAKRRVSRLREHVRRQTRPLRNPIDVWSLKCCQHIQRVGRGMLLRLSLRRKMLKRNAPMGMRRASSVADVSMMLVSKRKQRWIPLGYNPPKHPAERSVRLHAVEQQTRVNAATLMQAWWRGQVKRRRAADHALRMASLVFLNMRCICIQRWWRCMLRQSKFTIPVEDDLRLAAHDIVSAEELLIKRGVQAVALKKLWHQTVKSDCARKDSPKRKRNPASVAGRGALTTVASTSDITTSMVHDSSMASGCVRRAAEDSSMFDPDVTTKLLEVQRTAAAPLYRSLIKRRQQPAAIVGQRRPRYLPSIKDVPGSRFMSSLDVAIRSAQPEWNGSSTVGTPMWYAEPR